MLLSGDVHGRVFFSAFTAAVAAAVGSLHTLCETVCVCVCERIYGLGYVRKQRSRSLVTRKTG